MVIRASPDEQPLQRQCLPCASRWVSASLPALDRVFAPLLSELLADLGPRPWGLDEAQPVPGRAGVLGLRGEHLDHVAVGQRRSPAATSLPLTRAPMHRWPTSVCTAYAKSTGVDPAGSAIDVALRGEDVTSVEPGRSAASRGTPPAPATPVASRAAAAARPSRRTPPTARRRRCASAPCTSSARRCRIRPCGAWPGCGSATRPACRLGRLPSCATTGTC